MKLRRPLAKWRVTGDTASHAAYGVGPATDYAWPNDRALPIGTPVLAPFAATGIIPWGSREDIGGLALRMWSRDGKFLFVGQHLSGYAKDRPVNAGDVIAYSGNTGTLTSGPHLHCYIIASGVRMSMEDAIKKYGLAGSPATAGGEELDVVDAADRAAIADEVVERLLTFKMHGGATLADGTKIPTETFAERIRQIRRYVVGNAGRTIAIQRSVTGVADALEEAAAVELSKGDVTDVVRTVLQEANLAGLSKAEVAEAFKTALNGANITLDTQGS